MYKKYIEDLDDYANKAGGGTSVCHMKILKNTEEWIKISASTSIQCYIASSETGIYIKNGHLPTKNKQFFYEDEGKYVKYHSAQICYFIEVFPGRHPFLLGKRSYKEKPNDTICKYTFLDSSNRINVFFGDNNE